MRHNPHLHLFEAARPLDPLEFQGGGRLGTLSGIFEPEMISQKLGVPDQGPSLDGRSKHMWCFSIKGQRLALRDDHGHRWVFEGNRREQANAVKLMRHWFGDQYVNGRVR